MNEGDDLGPKTEGVETLLGNPKKAIIKLSIPMIIAMSVQTAYNLADAIWVSGLPNGTEALAAIGLFFPFFFMIMALATGLGIGGGSAISRKIGAKDKQGADNVANHMIALVVIVSLLFSIPMYFLFPEILRLMGAGSSMKLSVDYGRIIIGFSFIILFNNFTNAILRAEGDAKRAMYAMVVGSILNIILDPIFIYIFNLGVPGAAWATMLSFSVTLLIMFYWLFLRKDTFVSFHLRGFTLKMNIIKDIMRVGVPASLQQMSMSFNMIFLNAIVLNVGGDRGVAVFSTGWRVSSMAILPLMGIATAVVSVAGAAFGAKTFRKVKLSWIYAIKYGFMMEIPVALILYFLAPVITLAFTWSKGSFDIRGDLTMFLKFFSLRPLTAAFGMLSGSIFQGIGKGFNSLVVTILRTLVLSFFFAYLFGIIFDWGLQGIWGGILLGNAAGAIIGYLWVRRYLNRLLTGKISGKRIIPPSS